MKLKKLVILSLASSLLTWSCSNSQPATGNSKQATAQPSVTPSTSSTNQVTESPSSRPSAKTAEIPAEGFFIKGNVKYNKTVVSGAEIYIPFLDMKTTSDSSGNWKLDKLPTGSYLLIATYTDDNGRMRKYFSNIKTDTTANVNIELQNPGAVVVHTSLSDKPGELAGTDIYAKGDTTSIGKSDEKGRISLLTLPPGKQTIIISKAGYTPKSFDVEIKSDNMLMLNDNKAVSLEPRKEERNVKGVVLDQDKNPIPGVSVSIDDDHVTCTSSDGRYTLGNVPLSNQILRFYHPNYKFSPIKLDDTATEINNKLELREAIKAGSISGVLKYDFDNPLEGAYILLEPSGVMETSKTTGEFSFTGVNPGNYELNIFLDKYHSKLVPVTVKSNKSTALKRDIILDPVVNTQSIYYNNLEDSCLADNTDIPEDPSSITTPSEISGQLLPVGRVYQSGRKCRIGINLAGIFNPIDNSPLSISQEDITVVEDNKVKGFKFTPSESFRPMADIVFLVNTNEKIPKATLDSISAGFADFAKDLTARNINFQIGFIAYSDQIDPSKNPASIDSSDPAAYTVVGFEPITKKGGTIFNFINGLIPSYKEAKGSSSSEGLLDSIYWAYNNGRGISSSGAETSEFGWRKYSQKIFIVITNTTACESGSSTISPSSKWTVKSLGDYLKSNAAIHVVSPNSLVTTAVSGDPRVLASTTGGSWTTLAEDGNLNLTSLPMGNITQKSSKIEFIGNTTSATDPVEHNIRVIINNKTTGMKGEVTFNSKY